MRAQAPESSAPPSTSRPCDLIAIDLDGTLLNHKGEVTLPTVEAIRRARDAGVIVTICTGRNLRESSFAAEAIAQTHPVIVAGGAILSCPTSNKTLRRFAMHEPLVAELIDTVVEHGHAAVLLKDPSVSEHDYVIIHPEGEGALDPTMRWWFKKMKIPHRVLTHLKEDEHPEHTVRLGVSGTFGATQTVADRVRTTFDGRINMNHFPAIAPSEIPEDPIDVPVILEIFDASVNKWAAITHLADDLDLDADRIVAIGNDVNDLDMLADAALGIAVKNAIPEAIEAADLVAPANTEDGVAHAIDNLLSGIWSLPSR